MLADLKAQTAAVEAGFVHGAVLLHKPAAQVGVLQRAQLSAGVVIKKPLSEVEQGPQLAQSSHVRLHLWRIVVRSEKGGVVIGGDVAGLVNDVQKAGQQDLREKSIYYFFWFEMAELKYKTKWNTSVRKCIIIGLWQLHRTKWKEPLLNWLHAISKPEQTNILRHLTYTLHWWLCFFPFWKSHHRTDTHCQKSESPYFFFIFFF